MSEEAGIVLVWVKLGPQSALVFHAHAQVTDEPM